ncbi:hypothetical protein DM860_011947 [Cuscuta australis]|uniref:Uncharacterized protein n=1 Tax=Cuscuta australis TaxID=267555 RepID=A0A328D9L0_9ASTE|nr:hypothetical protein DM860_011947 [Cuscuta australis]
MGSVLSKAGDGIGNALAAPFKAVLQGSCDDVCAGVWDVPCFITHLCVSDLMKLFIILILCYITLLFFYMFFKLGICQCLGRTICGVYCSACKAYWSAMGCMACFFWHKLTQVERVNRRRHHFADIESGNIDGSFAANGGVSISERCPHSHLRRRRRHHHRPYMGGGEAGVRVQGRRLGSTRRKKKLRHHRHHHGGRKDIVVLGPKMASFKRRRIVA